MSQPWRNRIVGHGTENPEQLLANPKNWRVHPPKQQNGLTGVLDEIGYVRTVLVNSRTGNLIDGHLRVTLAMRRGEESIPVSYVDLSEREEQIILATLDPLANMAVPDIGILDELFQEINTTTPELQMLLAEVADMSGLYKEPKPEREPTDSPSHECPSCGHQW